MTRRWLLIIITATSLCFLAISSGYAGITNLKGWNHARVFQSIQEASGMRYHLAPDTDIDGEVGHPLFVAGPTANCEPGGQWSGRMEIASGNLPPGLSLDYGNGNISGIPTERGHWIVTMKDSHIRCNGEPCWDWTQQLRFHITGTGKVIQ